MDDLPEQRLDGVEGFALLYAHLVFVGWITACHLFCPSPPAYVLMHFLSFFHGIHI